MATLTFILVGSGGAPIYEADLTRAGDPGTAAGAAPSTPASDDAAAATSAPHLGAVDRFNALTVSAYASPSRLRLLLLHDGRPDDVVRGFFREVHEAVVKAALNPFFSDAVPVAAPGFDRRVRSLARSYFRTVG